jgi:hypothetical protein
MLRSRRGRLKTTFIQVSHPRSRPSTGIADRSPMSDRVRLSDDRAFSLRRGPSPQSRELTAGWSA